MVIVVPRSARLCCYFFCLLMLMFAPFFLVYFKQLSSKLDCDEEEIIAHAKELLEELTTKLSVEDEPIESMETIESTHRKGNECEDEEDDHMEL